MAAPRGNFKESTTSMFVQFAKSYFDAKEIPDDNKAMKSIAGTNAKLGGLIENLKSLPTFTSVTDEILILLDKLKAIPSTAAKQNYELGRSQSQKPLDDVKAEAEARQKLEQSVRELEISCFDRVREVVTIIKQSKNMPEKAGSQEIVNQLNGTEKAIAEQRKVLNQFTANHKQIGTALKSVKDDIANYAKAMGIVQAPTSAPLPMPH